MPGGGLPGEKSGRRQKQTGLPCIESALSGKIFRQGFSFRNRCGMIALGLRKLKNTVRLPKKEESSGKF